MSPHKYYSSILSIVLLIFFDRRAAAPPLLSVKFEILYLDALPQNAFMTSYDSQREFECQVCVLKAG